MTFPSHFLTNVCSPRTTVGASTGPSARTRTTSTWSSKMNTIAPLDPRSRSCRTKPKTEISRKTRPRRQRRTRGRTTSRRRRTDPSGTKRIRRRPTTGCTGPVSTPSWRGSRFPSSSQSSAGKLRAKISALVRKPKATTRIPTGWGGGRPGARCRGSSWTKSTWAVRTFRSKSLWALSADHPKATCRSSRDWGVATSNEQGPRTEDKKFKMNLRLFFWKRFTFLYCNFVIRAFYREKVIFCLETKIYFVNIKRYLLFFCCFVVFRLCDRRGLTREF